MKKPLRLAPLALTAARAALAALLLPLAGQEVLHTLAPLVLALLLGLAAALGWDRPNRPSHPLHPGEPPFPRRHKGAEPSPSPKHPCTIRRFFP